FLFAFGEDLEQQFGAALVEFHVAQFVDAQQVDAAVAGDGLGELLVVGSFDELVDELGGQNVADPEPGHGGLGAQADEQVGFAGAGREGDRLQHLRAVLPCEVRVISATHPLSGRLVAARSFKRLQGELLLVIELPDGAPGTIAADRTDVLRPAGAAGVGVGGGAGGGVGGGGWGSSSWRWRAGDGVQVRGDPGVRCLRTGPGPLASGAGGGGAGGSPLGVGCVG